MTSPSKRQSVIDLHHKEIAPIVKAVCLVYGISANDLTGTDRHHVLCDARRTFAEIAVRRTQFPISTIAKVLRRDHSTALAMLKVDNDLMQTDRLYRGRKEDVEIRLKKYDRSK